MKQFKLSDLLTAAQAQKIIDLLNEQQKQIEDLEKEIANLKNAQSQLAWRDVNLQTEIYNIYKEER